MFHSHRKLPPPPRIDRYSIIRSSVATGEDFAARKRLISVDVWSDFGRVMYVCDVNIDGESFDLMLTIFILLKETFTDSFISLVLKGENTICIGFREVVHNFSRFGFDYVSIGAAKPILYIINHK